MDLLRILDKFKYRDLHAFKTIMRQLQIHGYTVQEALEQIKGKTEALIDIPERECSECGEVMVVYAVNTSPCNAVGGSWNSQWLCPGCWHDEYTEKTIKEIREGGK